MLSLYDGGLQTNANLLANVGLLPLFSLEKQFCCKLNWLYVGVSNQRPVKDSNLHLCHQAELPYRHTSERITDTISTPVRAYLVIKLPKLL